eukprot:TRINITY_DN40367_c0_g1_i1.p2 TRINITY_DN40367_c0_g1~~TRINITY_DN40367_c0_g1_i1.p2  ORF type:complete len:451 (+),score=127.20 TRINITY_DN40367_c0_g1_i1:93-1445(+)
MVLTQQDREELHKDILDYLRANGFDATCEQLEAEIAEYKPTPGAPTTALDRKYRIVVGLTAKLRERDQQIQDLQRQLQEMADPTAKAHAHRDKDLMPSSQQSHVLKGHSADINAIVFHPTEAFVCSAADDGRVRLWDYETGMGNGALTGHAGAVKAVGVSHDGRHVATGCNDLYIRVFTWERKEQIRSLYGHDHAISSVDFVLPDSTRLVSASRDRTCKVWDWNAGHCVQTFKGHTEWVRLVKPNRGGKSCVSADDSGQVLLWHLGEEQKPCKIVGSVGGGGDSTVPEVGQFLNPAAEEVMLRALSKEKGASHSDPVGAGSVSEAVEAARERRRQQKEAEEAASADLDLRFFAVAGRDKQIHVFDLSNCSRVRVISGHDDWVRSLAFHVNGKVMFTSSDDGTIRVWAVKDGRCLSKIEAHDGFVSALAYHPAGRFLVSSCDKELKVWPCK